MKPTMRSSRYLLLLLLCISQWSFAQVKHNEITDHKELEKYNRESYGTLLPDGQWLNTSRKDIFWQKDRMFLLVVIGANSYESDVFIHEAVKLKEANQGLETFFVYSSQEKSNWTLDDLKHFMIKNQLSLPVYYTGGLMKSSPIDLTKPSLTLINKNFSIVKMCTELSALEEFEIATTEQMLNWSLLKEMDMSKSDTHDGELLVNRPIGLINYPVAVATDPGREVLWVWNAGDHQIIEMSFDGKIINVIGNGRLGHRDGSYEKSELGSSGRMVFDRTTAKLYLVDHQSNTLRAIDTLSKTITTLLGTGEPAMTGMPAEIIPAEKNKALAGPTDLGIYNGEIFMTMRGDHSIWKYDLSSGKAKRELGSSRSVYADGKKKKADLESPQAIAVDGSGKIYFSESDSGAVRYFDGKKISTLKSEYEFSPSLSLIVRDDSLSVLDEFYNRIVCGNSNELNLRFGKDEAGYEDKTGKNARFHYPMAIAEARGFYYVTDAGNQVIRIIEPEIKVVQTLPIQESESLRLTKSSTSGSGTTVFLDDIHLAPDDNLVEIIMELPDGYSIPYNAETSVVLFDNDGDELITYDLSEGELLFNCIGEFKNVNLSFEVNFEYIKNDNPLVKYYKTERVILPFTPVENEEFTQDEHRVLYEPLKF